VFIAIVQAAIVPRALAAPGQLIVAEANACTETCAVVGIKGAQHGDVVERLMGTEADRQTDGCGFQPLVERIYSRGVVGRQGKGEELPA
jgi:hypothetical protein